MITNSLIIFMLYNSVVNRRDQTILVTRIGLIIIIYCIIISYFNFNFYLLENGIVLFGGVYAISSTGYFFHVFIFLLSYIIIGLNGFYPRKIQLPETDLVSSYELAYEDKTSIISKTAEQFKIIEYTLMLLFVVIGALFLVSSNDLVSLFLSIELQSYGLYLICTIYRNSEPSTGGGLIYFLLGGLSSCFIVLSTSLLYSNSGTTNLNDIYIITTISETDDFNNNIAYSYKPYYIHMSLIIMGVGLLFKVSAAPFHFWSPVVYDGIPTIVTTFVANVSKISIFIFLLELVQHTSKSLFDFNWTIILLVSSLLSLIIGTVLGLTQSRIKRLYAYSTISHVGFILLALNIQTVDSIQAFIFYLIQYSLSNLNAFVLLLAIGFTFYCYVNENKEYKQLQDINNSPIQVISQLKGYFYLNPVLTLSLSITLFSFIGVPPLIGFFAKQYVLISALDRGYNFMSLITILTSVISAAYYLFVIKQLFFEKNENKMITSRISSDKNELTLSQYDKISKSLEEKQNINIIPEKNHEISSIEIVRFSKYNKKLKFLQDNDIIKFLLEKREIKRSSNSKFIGVLYSDTIIKKFEFNYNNIILSSHLTITISILTLFLLVFMFNNNYILNMISILTLSIFYN